MVQTVCFAFSKFLLPNNHNANSRVNSELLETKTEKDQCSQMKNSESKYMDIHMNKKITITNMLLKGESYLGH